jgi:hypothetical protein
MYKIFLLSVLYTHKKNEERLTGVFDFVQKWRFILG